MRCASAIPNHLLQDIRAFDAIEESLVEEHAGKAVLIKAAELQGIFSTIDEANAEGKRRFGSETFLIRKIRSS